MQFGFINKCWFHEYAVRVLSPIRSRGVCHGSVRCAFTCSAGWAARNPSIVYSVFYSRLVAPAAAPFCSSQVLAQFKLLKDNCEAADKTCARLAVVERLLTLIRVRDKGGAVGAALGGVLTRLRDALSAAAALAAQALPLPKRSGWMKQALSATLRFAAARTIADGLAEVNSNLDRAVADLTALVSILGAAAGAHTSSLVVSVQDTVDVVLRDVSDIRSRTAADASLACSRFESISRMVAELAAREPAPSPALAAATAAALSEAATLVAQLRAALAGLPLSTDVTKELADVRIAISRQAAELAALAHELHIEGTGGVAATSIGIVAIGGSDGIAATSGSNAPTTTTTSPAALSASSSVNPPAPGFGAAALTAARVGLPPGWLAELDDTDGEVYYVRPDGTSTWDRPPAPTRLSAGMSRDEKLAAARAGLPPGWDAVVTTAADGGLDVYYVTPQRQSTWERPPAPTLTVPAPTLSLADLVGWSQSDAVLDAGSFGEVRRAVLRASGVPVAVKTTRLPAERESGAGESSARIIDSVRRETDIQVRANERRGGGF